MPCDHCTARYMRIAYECKQRCTLSRSTSRFPLVQDVGSVGLGIDEEVRRACALSIIKRQGGTSDVP